MMGEEPSGGDLPEPMTPAECDLRGMPFMPIDVIRLLDSDLFALATGDEFKAAFALWGKSWFQVPAGSLPVDDRVLAHLSGHRGGPWSDVRDMALRGWTQCSDGRLYHPVVAEKAIDAWGRRGKWREREDGKTDRQQRWREKLRILSKRLREAGATVPERPKAKELEALCRQHDVDANVDDETSTVDAKTTAKDRGQGTGDRGHKSIRAKALGAADATPTKKPPSGSRLPDDWTLPTDWLEWAVSVQGWTAPAANDQAARFADYWHGIPGAKGRKANWQATWRNWIRNADQNPRGRGRAAANGQEYLGV